MQYATASAGRRGEDALGPNSDIGMRLRAFYAAVQDQTIPERFLELLEKLDQVEQQAKSDASQE